MHLTRMPLDRLRVNSEAFVVVGRIAGAFGVRGELKCDPTSAGRTAISAGAYLRLECRGEAQTVRIAAVRQHRQRLLLRIEGIDDATAAAGLTEARLSAPRSAIELAQGEYLDDDLIGCTVVGTDGTRYGTVSRVEHYPASDMLVVNNAMIPMVGAIVVRIDLPGRCIEVDPPQGLL